MICAHPSRFEILRKKIPALAPLCMLLVVCGVAAALVSIQRPDGERVLDSSGHLQPVKRMAQLRHLPRQLHRKLNDQAYTSVNWAGYAVTGAQGSVTNVQASWVVPAVTDCSTVSGDGPNVYASFWTGIDGWTSSTVEQIGTDSDCQNSKGANTPSGYYYAWYEFYPNGAYYIGSPSNNFAGYAVYAGDTMNASVTSSGSCSTGARHGGSGKEFTVTITDVTPGHAWANAFSTSLCMSAQQTSAEWITETPYGCNTRSGYCYLPDFVSAGYGPNSTPSNNGVAESATVTGVGEGDLGYFGNSVQQSIMVNANTPATGDIPMSDVMAYPYNSCVSPPAPFETSKGILTSCSESSVTSDIVADTGTSFQMQWNGVGP